MRARLRRPARAPAHVRARRCPFARALAPNRIGGHQRSSALKSMCRRPCAHEGHEAQVPAPMRARAGANARAPVRHRGRREAAQRRGVPDSARKLRH